MTYDSTLNSHTEKLYDYFTLAENLQWDYNGNISSVILQPWMVWCEYN